MFTLNNTVAALDRIALNDVLDRQTLLALSLVGRGSAGVIVQQLLFVHLMRKVEPVGEQPGFYMAWCRAINRLSRELTQTFVDENGRLDWTRLLKAS